MSGKLFKKINLFPPSWKNCVILNRKIMQIILGSRRVARATAGKRVHVLYMPYYIRSFAALTQHRLTIFLLCT